MNPTTDPVDATTPALATRAATAALVTLWGYDWSTELAGLPSVLAALAFLVGIVWFARDGTAFLFRAQLYWETRGYKHE